MKKINAVLLFATLAVRLVVAAQAPVNLGSAANFAVLAGSTVTNTGATTVVGSLGVSPGTAVTGFPPGTVIGTIYDNDPTSAAAEADLSTAFNDAGGRTVGPIAVAGNIGGLTLVPGLYKSTSSLAVSSGTLTLNGAGVYIFQIASALTTTTGTQVVLTGGATAANVFWQVGSSATLGTSSTFAGTIMAYASISLATGAVLTGRALAETGAVTLEGNAVASPGGATSGAPPPGTLPPPPTSGQVVVPYLDGLPLSNAVPALTSAGLVLGTVSNQACSTTAAGNVIAENPPAGSTAVVGTAVNLVLCNGPLVSPIPPCSSISAERIIPQVADGGNWTTEIYIVNTSETGPAATFTLSFYGDDGQAKEFTFQGLGSQSTLTGTLGPLESTVFRTTGAGQATEGWAEFNTTSVALNGVAVSTNSNGYEAAISLVTPTSGDLILPFDNTNGHGSGVAVVNLQNSSQTIQVNILDQNANVITTGQVALSAMGHTSFDMAQRWPLTAGKVGAAIFKGAGALLEIRYTNNNVYTSISGLPVL
jgi:type VI secretion system secreted protein VgrG